MKRTSRKGFTLIESVLYTALLSMALVVLVSLLTAGLNTHSLIAGQQRLFENRQLAEAVITQRLSEASSISVPSSGTSNTLTINSPTSSENPIVFQVTNGILTMKLGTQPPVDLTSKAIQVATFSVTRMNGETPSITIAISYQTNTSSGANLKVDSSFAYTLRYE